MSDYETMNWPASAVGEVRRLRAQVEALRNRLSPGALAFFHRHRALMFVRKEQPALYNAACQAAQRDVERELGVSFEDALAAALADAERAHEARARVEAEAAETISALRAEIAANEDAMERLIGEAIAAGAERDTERERRTLYERLLAEAEVEVARLREQLTTTTATEPQ